MRRAWNTTAHFALLTECYRWVMGLEMIVSKPMWSTAIRAISVWFNQA